VGRGMGPSLCTSVGACGAQLADGGLVTTSSPEHMLNINILYINILENLCLYIPVSPCPQSQRVRVPLLRLDTRCLPSGGRPS
jgi:hypothetical protein